MNTPVDSSALIKRLEDQTITSFNAQMRVREEAAIEIRRLALELAEFKRRWDALRWIDPQELKDLRRCCDKQNVFGGPGIGGGGFL